jgi:hypothetical protein
VICGWRSYARHDGAGWVLPDFCRCGLELLLAADFAAVLEVRAA